MRSWPFGLVHACEYFGPTDATVRADLTCRRPYCIAVAKCSLAAPSHHRPLRVRPGPRSPVQLTGPETKRYGKPSMPFNPRKFVTAHISREGHAYKVGCDVWVNATSTRWGVTRGVALRVQGGCGVLVWRAWLATSTRLVLHNADAEMGYLQSLTSRHVGSIILCRVPEVE